MVLAGSVGILASVFAPALVSTLAYAPQLLITGQVWRAFTWPFVDGFSLFSVLNLVLLWLFGRELERTLGRNKMAWFFVGIWASLTLANTVAGFLLPPGAIYGLGLVELVVLLIWISEYPTRQFFFGIPAWVFGLFILALQVLPAVAARSWNSLLSLLLSLALVAIAARSVGLLSAYSWIPGGPGQKRPAKQRPPTKAQQRQSERRASDEERMDQLLDKINAAGLGALSKAERAELEKLRLRRR